LIIIGKTSSFKIISLAIALEQAGYIDNWCMFNKCEKRSLSEIVAMVRTSKNQWWYKILLVDLYEKL